MLETLGSPERLSMRSLAGFTDQISTAEPRNLAVDVPDYNELVPFSETELGIRFDEIVELAASQPDSELFSQELRAIVLLAKERGNIDASIYMAAILGGMACLHSHMEGIANEAADGLPGREKNEKLYAHDHEETVHEHDVNNCKRCQKGLPCKDRK